MPRSQVRTRFESDPVGDARVLGLRDCLRPLVSHRANAQLSCEAAGLGAMLFGQGRMRGFVSFR